MKLTFVVKTSVSKKAKTQEVKRAVARVEKTIKTQSQALSQFVRKEAASLGVLKTFQALAVDTSSCTTTQDKDVSLPPKFDATVLLKPTPSPTPYVSKPTPQPTVKATTAAPVLQTVAPTSGVQYEVVTTGTTYQMGAYPYLHGGGQWNKAASVKACLAQCEKDPKCLFGTFVDRKGVLHTFANPITFSRFGECWLSSKTHKTQTKCGVDCIGFKKVVKHAHKTRAPTPAPTPKQGCQCTCDPASDPSMYTKCQQDPFGYSIHVTHLAANKHRIRMHADHKHGKTQHVCKMLGATKGKFGGQCKCCDCSCRGTPTDIKEIGFGFHTATAPFLFPGTTNIHKTAVACQNQCSKTANCLYGTYITTGYQAGECWLSHNSAARTTCEKPCQSFVKVGSITDNYAAFVKTATPTNVKSVFHETYNWNLRAVQARKIRSLCCLGPCKHRDCHQVFAH